MFWAIPCRILGLNVKVMIVMLLCAAFGCTVNVKIIRPFRLTSSKEPYTYAKHVGCIFIMVLYLHGLIFQFAYCKSFRVCIPKHFMVVWIEPDRKIDCFLSGRLSRLVDLWVQVYMVLQTGDCQDNIRPWEVLSIVRWCRPIFFRLIGVVN